MNTTIDVERGASSDGAVVDVSESFRLDLVREHSMDEKKKKKKIHYWQALTLNKQIHWFVQRTALAITFDRSRCFQGENFVFDDVTHSRL